MEDNNGSDYKETPKCPRCFHPKGKRFYWILGRKPYFTYPPVPNNPSDPANFKFPQPYLVPQHQDWFLFRPDGYYGGATGGLKMWAWSNDPVLTPMNIDETLRGITSIRGRKHVEELQAYILELEWCCLPESYGYTPFLKALDIYTSIRYDYIDQLRKAMERILTYLASHRSGVSLADALTEYLSADEDGLIGTRQTEWLDAVRNDDGDPIIPRNKKVAVRDQHIEELRKEIWTIDKETWLPCATGGVVSTGFFYGNTSMIPRRNTASIGGGDAWYSNCSPNPALEQDYTLQVWGAKNPHYDTPTPPYLHTYWEFGLTGSYHELLTSHTYAQVSGSGINLISENDGYINDTQMTPPADGWFYGFGDPHTGSYTWRGGVEMRATTGSIALQGDWGVRYPHLTANKKYVGWDISTFNYKPTLLRYWGGDTSYTELNPREMSAYPIITITFNFTDSPIWQDGFSHAGSNELHYYRLVFDHDVVTPYKEYPIFAEQWCVIDHRPLSSFGSVRVDAWTEISQGLMAFNEDLYGVKGFDDSIIPSVIYLKGVIIDVFLEDKFLAYNLGDFGSASKLEYSSQIGNFNINGMTNIGINGS